MQLHKVTVVAVMTLCAGALSGCNAGIAAGIALLATSGTSRSTGTVSQTSIESVQPAQASHAGGTTITISGSNFPGDATVSVGGIAATNVRVASAGTLTAVIPRSSKAGPADVVVTNSQGGEGILAGGFLYTNTPPTASVMNLASPQTGNIVLRFTVSDPESDAASVRLEIDSGSGFQPIRAGQIIAGEVDNIATSPAGTRSSVTFDSTSAFSQVDVIGVRFRVTPIDSTDASVGTPSISAPFDIVNNSPPTIQIFQPGTSAYHVVLSYQFADVDTRDRLMVTGLEWADHSTGKSGSMTVSSGQGIGAAPGGVVTTVWNAFADIGFGNNHLVTVTVSASDGFATAQATSAPFFVNDGPLSDPITLKSREVGFGFAVGDLTGDGRPDIISAAPHESGIAVQLFVNLGRSFSPGVLFMAPTIPDPSSPFPGGGGFQSALTSLAQAAVLDTNGDGALDAVFPDVTGGTLSAANLRGTLAAANAEAPRYVHVIAHQSALVILQAGGSVDVPGGTYQTVMAPITQRAPQTFVARSTLFPPVATGDAALDNVGWFNQAILAADLDGPGTQGGGSTDLVLLQGISQLGRANGGDSRGCVVIRQVDPTSSALGPTVYLDPTDMGSLPLACAVGDILSSTRTGALYTAAPLSANAPLGSPDVVVANTGDGSLTFYLQLSSATWVAGTYTPPRFTSVKVDMSSFIPGTGAGDLAGVQIGDLNGDGAADLVVVGRSTQTLTVFVHDTDPAAPGSLLPATGGLIPLRKATVLSLGNFGAVQPALASVSGAGRLDIVESFTDAPEVIVFANTGNIAGDPQFTPVSYPVLDTTQGVLASDFNGDGRADIVALPRFTPLVFYQVTQGTLDERFTAVATGSVPQRLTVGDVLGLGVPQIVCPNRGDGTVQIFQRDSTLLLTPAASFDVSTPGTFKLFLPGSSTFADATGDGKPDLVLWSQNAIDPSGASVGATAILRGIVTPATTVSSVTSNVGGNAGNVDVGDLDEDGIPDLVVGTQVGLLVLSGTGGGNFTQSIWLPGQRALSVKIIDLDGDGHLDVVVAVEGSISVFFNGGAPFGTPGFLGYGKFAAAPVPISLSDDATALAFEDLDRNGLLDVVAVHAADGLGFIVFQTAARTFTDVPLVVGGHPGQIAIGDLNGDGLPDIAITWGTDSIVAIYYQNPTRTGLTDTFLPPVTYPTLGSPEGCAILDVNGDGRNDVVVSSQTTNTLNVFLQR